jgi:hypothetical protein
MDCRPPGAPAPIQPLATFTNLKRTLVARQAHPVPTIPMVEGARTMANYISPAAQLFRSMADLIDHDHTSHTDYEAVTRAAEALAARASTEQLVAGPLWEADGASLLAAAYAFHAGLPRQAATTTHVQALIETSPAPSNGGVQASQRDPIASTAGNSAGRTAPLAPPPGPRATPVDPKRLPGPSLHHLDPADEAKLWTALSELRRGQVVPRGQLIRLTGWLPTDLAVQLLALLERGPALVAAEAARLREVIDLNDPTTPALAVVTLGWLEAAEQVLTAGSTAQDLQVLLSVAGRQS